MSDAALPKRWMRLLTITFAAAVVSALPVIALYHLRQPSLILQVFFYTMVCAAIIGALITVSLVRFGLPMYLQRFPLNWALISGTILACTAAGSLAANLVFLALHNLPDRDFWSSFWLVYLFAAAVALIFGLSGFMHEVLRTTLEARQLEEERARKWALEAQLASLESHIRPHFLFNSLNTISSLIPDDPKLAESLIGKLAALLRSSLDANPLRLAPLASELKMVRDYLEIETARFGDRLRYRIDVPRELESAEVPSFCLQTLVENSVKFAVAPREKGGTVHITAHVDGMVCLEVSDDGPGFTAEAIHPGHGLDNLKSRLAALYGTSAKLEIENDVRRPVVRLRFPR
jgi:sensor histidine kinase YesM